MKALNFHLFFLAQVTESNKNMINTHYEISRYTSKEHADKFFFPEEKFSWKIKMKIFYKHIIFISDKNDKLGELQLGFGSLETHEIIFPTLL